MPSVAESQFAAALHAAEVADATAEERAEMLMEIAMGMQSKPKSPQQLKDAVALYERAFETAPADAPLLRARIRARLGTALQALPDGDVAVLERACACFEAALVPFEAAGRAEEAAEVEMNLGLALQALSVAGHARIQDAIQRYHHALRVFRRETHPQEFAILHNNLAVAYLSIPATDENARMREALAVQSFEEMLTVINLVDHPGEYAMVQNNLGNALQYASSSHTLENNLRALTAYDEALRVRNPRDTPIEYANTIANKANVLRNLPAGIDAAAGGDPLAAARALYDEARELFERHGEFQRTAIVAEALAGIDTDLAGPRAEARSAPLH